MATNLPAVYSFVLLLLLLNLIFLQTTTVLCEEAFLKVTRFHVPTPVMVGETVRLSCYCELSGETLRAIKFFKDDQEFYRYTPAANQVGAGKSGERLTFPLPGVQVDFQRSNEHDVWLKNVNRLSGGTYKCQVSVEDTFKSVSAEKKMTVMDRNSAGSRARPHSTQGGGGGGDNQGVGGMFAGAGKQPQQRHAVQQQPKYRGGSNSPENNSNNHLTTSNIIPVQSQQQTPSSLSSNSAANFNLKWSQVYISTTTLIFLTSILLTIPPLLR